MDHLSISRVAAGLRVSWNTANTAVLAEGRRVLIDDPARFHGVRVLGLMNTFGVTPGWATNTSRSSST
ncbi:Transposase [Leifsonia rubra CMS 76R]|nr:Transposase [Leifsonia rubra CMS 76R]